MSLSERRVQEIGKSLLITLPKGWANVVGIKKGTTLKVNISEKGNLTISPESVNVSKKTQVAIPFDEYFSRRFFREYFGGAERIAITINENIPASGRKEIYSFLKRFMNVQIIEENPSKIVVKCFRIDELSIEECLRRMHFLVLSMMDESAKGSVKPEEMRDSIARFYYLLVMQVRRYLTEGEFAKENEISLIRALDFRMVAEKVNRIASILLDGIDLKTVKRVRPLYEKGMGCFLKSDFEGSLSAWHEIKMELDSISGKNNARTSFLEYAREITSLIR